MSAYILSILGIVVAGVVIDIILPSGSINKYIKSLYSIFVVAVILTPIINFATNKKDLNLKYKDIEVNEKLIEYIYNQKANQTADAIETELTNNGFENIDIKINFCIENNQLIYSSCVVNLKNLVLQDEAKHIDKYEFIIKVVENHTDLSKEVIIFNE